MFQFNPLFFRRSAFVASWAAFGAGMALHGLLSFALLVLSFGLTVTEQYLAKSYGEAAQPLLPALPQLPPLPKGRRVLVLGATALVVFFFMPPLIRLVYPGFGGFAPDTINAYTLGAFQYFTALTLAYAGWRWLFPSLYTYAAETMEGKLLESITSDLLGRIPTVFDPYAQLGVEILHTQLAALAERRKIATLQFITRCARFVFSVSPFVFFFVQANHALTAALTAVPASVPGL